MKNSIELVRQLVNDFKVHEATYLRSDYPEQRVREDFLNKFFIALGWDVTHEQQKNPYEQEVKIEPPVRTGKSQRRADYAFFVGPNFRDPKFFVEAKKPSKSLANPGDYYQIIRYAYNKKIPISVLTDFEEFHIIDCRFMPDMNTALDRRIANFHYSEYADEEKFSLIFHLFGREAVAAGSIEKRAAELPKPKGKGAQAVSFKGGFLPIDEAFLEKLDDIRLTLAKSFKKHNQDLESEELTEAVQRTIDRLVFIRFLEDKNIEESHIANLTLSPSPLKGEGRGEVGAWKAFVSLCRSLEPKYNGLVFKHHSLIDENKFVPPEEEFAEICNELSDPNSPYLFDEIPISILGSIYERFLGKVVHATPKRADVEDKPEVRKAGGVYYTPEYIVRYIVQNTVGKLLQPPSGSLLEKEGEKFGKTPEEISQMAFADIACGSGSFLIEVYSELLDYHTRYYSAYPEKAKPGDTQMRDGNVVLSLKKRQEILLNNIYGVDIDYQATEVTQLSLYLKLLEDVTMNDAYQFSLIKEKILPDLKQNIVCGNSLIGTDILEGDLFEKTDERKLNPMNFADAFPKVMKRGGFDAIVGNPPYVRQEMISDFKSYLEVKYKVYHGVADLYTFFIEKGISTLRQNGLYGIIVANKWMRANYGEPLRKWLKRLNIEKIIDFGDLPVFQSATTYPCVLIAENKPVKDSVSVTNVKTLDFQSIDIYVKENQYSIDLSKLDDKAWSLSNDFVQSILKKMEAENTKLHTYVKGKIYRGVTTGCNDAFVIDDETKKTLVSKGKNVASLIKPFLTGSDIKRYCYLESDHYLIFAKRGIDINEYVPIRDYLTKFKSRLMPRPKSWKGQSWEGRKPGTYKWYEIQDSTEYYSEFERPKILLPDISTRGNFTLDKTGTYYVGNTGYIICSEDKYLLGILNSQLITFYYKNLTSTIRGGYLRFISQYLEQIPIRTINFSDPADKSRHDHIVKLVEQMLSAKEKLASAKLESEKDRLELLCASLDRQIDEAVYELYGLTAEEIKVVEGESNE